MKNKTQKNWKEIRTGVIFTIIIGAGLFLVVHILSLNYLNKQSFNITIEECWNETQENSTFQDFEIDNTNFTLGFHVNTSVIKCKQVEVDKMNTLPEGVSCFGEECDNLWMKTKEDLNIEWLEENCECIENIKYTHNSAENSINVPCSKYKCGDYFVGVLN